MNAGLHMSETCTGVHAPPRLTAGQKARAIAFPSVVAREEAYLERKLGDIYRRLPRAVRRWCDSRST